MMEAVYGTVSLVSEEYGPESQYSHLVTTLHHYYTLQDSEAFEMKNTVHKS